MVGTGPAGPDLATLRALAAIKKADAYLCWPPTGELFREYLAGKEFMGDPWKGMFDYRGKPYEKLDEAGLKKWRESRIRIRDQIVAKIKTKLAMGKNVALLDEGDPCVFAPGHWFTEGFEDEELEIIPGVGCFQAAAAALKKSMIPAYQTKFVALTGHRFLLGPSGQQDEALRQLCKHETTMVFYMTLGTIDNLVEKLRKYCPPDFPVAVVYYAGFPEKEKIVRGTLETIVEKVKAEKEKWLGLVIVGKCLKGKPYRSFSETMK